MPSVLRYGLSLLRAPALELGFVLRSCLRWSRGHAGLPDEPKHDLFAARPAAQRTQLERRAAALTRAFDLDALHARSTRRVFASNLARLDALTRLAEGLSLPTSTDGIVRAADFGSGDFHYATALQRWLSRHGGGARATVLRGFELDGHGIYRDGHSRADHARAHAGLAGIGSTAGSELQFAVADCTALRLPPQDVVTMFFPFLTAYASLRWGTPLSRLRPRRLLRRAVENLRPGGWLVVTNQTAHEAERLRRLLLQAPVRAVVQGGFASDLAMHAEPTQGQQASIWQRL